MGPCDGPLFGSFDSGGSVLWAPIWYMVYMMGI